MFHSWFYTKFSKSQVGQAMAELLMGQVTTALDSTSLTCSYPEVLCLFHPQTDFIEVIVGY